jgi:hypothetical protein
MDKPISRIQHGFADYTYAPLALALPKLAGFEHQKKAVLLTKIISSNVLLTTLFTRAEWGVFKKIPFKTHLALDVAMGALIAGAPWLFGFSHHKNARNAFLAMGTVSLLAGSLTQADEMPANESEVAAS